MSTSLLVACLVIGVADGDSIKVQCPARVKAISVRLAGIDAPEIVHKTFHIEEQPGGRESKASLVEMCLKQPATLHRTATDRYGRMVAQVECAGLNVNAEQLRRGQAWAYMASKRSQFPKLEAKARADGVGLWAVPNPIKPSDWRKGIR